jgi:hypothetical protein
MASRGWSAIKSSCYGEGFIGPTLRSGHPGIAIGSFMPGLFLAVRVSSNLRIRGDFSGFVATKRCYETGDGKAQGLFRRGTAWWGAKDVPKGLRGIVGQLGLQKTLASSAPETATIRFHSVMQGFEARLAMIEPDSRGRRSMRRTMGHEARR